MKVVNPFTSRSSGKLGGSVFYTSYGENIVRSKPLVYIDNPSESLLKARLFFKSMNTYFKQLKYVIALYFNYNSSYKSPKSLFYTYNYNLLDSITGKLDPLKIKDVLFTIGQKVILNGSTWNYSIDTGLSMVLNQHLNYPYNSGWINVTTVMYNERSCKFEFKVNYQEGKFKKEFKLIDVVPGDKLHLFVIVLNQNLSGNTNSVYQGFNIAV